MTDLLDDAITNLRDALNRLDLNADDIAEPETAAAVLLDLATVKRQAGEVYAKYEMTLLSLMGEGRTLDVPDLGRFTAKKVTKRSGWVWDRLVPDLVVKARSERKFDGDSGEVEGEGEATARVLRSCIGFSYGKVQALRALGLDADEYATTEEAGWSVQLPSTEFGK